jgi:hypothetical protein
LPVEDICRTLGVSQATYFRWKQTYAELGTAEVRRLKQLEEENKRLRQLVEQDESPSAETGMWRCKHERTRLKPNC